MQSRSTGLTPQSIATDDMWMREAELLFVEAPEDVGQMRKRDDLRVSLAGKTVATAQFVPHLFHVVNCSQSTYKCSICFDH
jgi:hypothetical protein